MSCLRSIKRKFARAEYPLQSARRYSCKSQRGPKSRSSRAAPLQTSPTWTSRSWTRLECRNVRISGYRDQDQTIDNRTLPRSLITRGLTRLSTLVPPPQRNWGRFSKQKMGPPSHIVNEAFTESSTVLCIVLNKQLHVSK